MTREAIGKGDCFLLAPSRILGVADRNRGISKEDVLEMVVRYSADLESVAEEAYDFAEKRIWLN
jgi:hypothetical protein